MHFLELSQARRSCRRYSGTAVSREALGRCLEAARLAPSACNSQPWRFIVIDTPEQRNSIAHKAFSGVHAMNAFAKDAPVLVAVVRERSKYAALLGGTFRGVRFSLIDIGIACEHFILQAHEEGLGTCWIGWFNERAVKRILGLSHREKIDIIISVGYPADEVSSVKNRKTLSQMSEFR